MRSSGFQEVLPFLIFVIALYGGILIGAFVSYILSGIGILNLSQSRGLRNGWLGFIPIVSQYQLGVIAGEIEMGNKKIKNPGLWMTLIPVVFYGAFFTFYFSYIFVLIGSTIGQNHRGPQSQQFIFSFMSWFIIAYLLLLAGIILASIIKLLALHRIYSCYYDGQRPVFYVILSAFVPFALPILLFRLGKKPMLYPPAYMYNNAFYPQSAQQYQQVQQPPQDTPPSEEPQQIETEDQNEPT